MQAPYTASSPNILRQLFGTGGPLNQVPDSLCAMCCAVLSHTCCKAQVQPYLEHVSGSLPADGKMYALGQWWQQGWASKWNRARNDPSRVLWPTRIRMQLKTLIIDGLNSCVLRLSLLPRGVQRWYTAKLSSSMTTPLIVLTVCNSINEGLHRVNAGKLVLVTPWGDKLTLFVPTPT